MATENSQDDTFRYQGCDTWLKGNTHIHTTASDGGTPAPEVAAMYAGAGYDFLFRTDHWVTSDVTAEAGPAPLLWVDGMELDGVDPDGSYYHVICLGKLSGITREMGFAAALVAAREQGAITVLAHPFWSGNTLEDALRWPFDGVEAYNHVCHWLNGKSDGAVHWHAMLDAHPGTLGLASDDAHLRPEHPGWNGGWVMVNAPECSAAAVLAALRAGRFYSSCGPEILGLTCAGSQLQVRTSPVRFVRLVGPGYSGDRRGAFDGSLLTEVTLDLPADWPYIYLEIEDASGRRAWTNTLFV